MFRGHYDNWTKTRMNAIKKYIQKNFFVNKTLLELGGGHGHNGNEFSKLGCNVTSSDARDQHINIGKNLYPHINFKLIDGDKNEINQKYDIILHWGLLYHLVEIENHLKNVCKNCDVILLETEVTDSNDDKYFWMMPEKRGEDQAYNGYGIKPSPFYVEKILKQNGFDFLLIKDSIINSHFHTYDWEITNTKKWRPGLRRFWICWKNNIDPKSILNNSIFNNLNNKKIQKKTKKIGILMKDFTTIYANGCNQQGLFVYQTLQKIDNIECFLYTNRSKTTDFLGITIKNIEENWSELQQLDCLIGLSLGIVETKYLQDLLKS